MTATKINTGGVKPMWIDGKIKLEVIDAGVNDFTSRFIVSVYGWKRRYTTGQGNTVEAAVRDWCRCTGNDYETVKNECVIGETN